MNQNLALSGEILFTNSQILSLQVHIRVASPPIKHPCYMGINIPTKEELIYNKMPFENLASHFGKLNCYYYYYYYLLLLTFKATKRYERKKKEEKRCRHASYPAKKYFRYKDNA